MYLISKNKGNIMVDLESFVKIYVENWRNSFRQLSENEQSIILKTGFSLDFFDPLQIEVISFKNSAACLWIITHDKERADLLLTFKLDIEEDPKVFFKNQKKLAPDWYNRFKKGIEMALISLEISKNFGGEMITSFDTVTYYLSGKELLNTDPAKKAQKDIRILLLETRIELEKENLDRNTEEILTEVNLIQDETQRKKLLSATEEIISSLGKLKSYEEQDKKIAGMKEEIGDVRKLIGTSIEFQDWRLLIDDVERLKNSSFVSRDLFDNVIKRLDQRIDDLREIKFWSKRTILDVSLAVIATASTLIAALLGAGIIHF